MNKELFPEGRCPDCRMYGGQWIDGKHTCTVWDGPECSTPWCDEPTVFTVVGAPGTGRGWTCRGGHFEGHVRELTLDDVR